MGVAYPGVNNHPGVTLTENELLTQVLNLCDKYDLRVYHSPDSRRSVGNGFPDLVICGHQHVLFAELKGPVATLRSEQVVWHYRLTGAGAWWRLWRPADYEAGTIGNTLRDL